MLTDLHHKGWMIVQGVRTTSDLMELANSLGRPLAAPTGELVKVLRPLERDQARPTSLSATYGRGEFPFHTDTAFWPRPTRYLVMRVVGDKRRTTQLLNFEHLWRTLDAHCLLALRRSIWRTGRAGTIFCPLEFRVGQTRGWRYDVQAMAPINSSATRARDAVDMAIQESRDKVEVSWPSADCLVIDNWRVLHARGPAPPDEGARFLFRVYVE